jgi:hypothetical protein
MPVDLQKAEQALRAAHRAGDVGAARKIAQGIRQAQSQASTPSMPAGLARSAAQGATFNFADEIEAGARALYDTAVGSAPFSESYGRNVADIRQSLEGFREEHPALAFGAELGGAVLAPGLGAAKFAGTAAPTLAGRVVRGLGVGAAAGGLAGAGAAEGGLAERGKGAVGGAVVGGGIGAAIPLAGAAAAKIGRVAKFWDKARGPRAPGVETLEKEAGALYERARNAGVQIAPTAWTSAVDDIAARVSKEGIDPTLHPRATAVLKRLVDTRDRAITLDETETMRRVLKDAASSSAPDERRIANIIIDKFDDWREGLRSSDLVTGDINAIAMLPKARGLWSRAKKGEVIGELIDRAELRASQFSQSGTENALRTEFRQLARNAKRMRTFSKEEQDAIKAVANGSPVANAVRFLGKFAPRGVVSTALGGGVGFAATGSPVGSAALLAAGEVGRTAASKMTKARALAAQELALGGRALPVPPVRLGGGPAAQALTTGLAVPAAERVR